MQASGVTGERTQAQHSLCLTLSLSHSLCITTEESLSQRFAKENMDVGAVINTSFVSCTIFIIFTMCVGQILCFFLELFKMNMLNMKIRQTWLCIFFHSVK